MNTKNWKDIAELVGIAAIVASLVFVGQEIQQSREIARLEWTGVLAAEQVALDSLLSSEAEVWRKGCAGSELSPTEQTVFTRLFSSFHHFAFARWVRGNVGLTGANPLCVFLRYKKRISTGQANVATDPSREREMVKRTEQSRKNGLFRWRKLRPCAAFAPYFRFAGYSGKRRSGGVGGFAEFLQKISAGRFLALPAFGRRAG